MPMNMWTLGAILLAVIGAIIFLLLAGVGDYFGRKIEWRHLTRVSRRRENAKNA